MVVVFGQVHTVYDQIKDLTGAVVQSAGDNGGLSYFVFKKNNAGLICDLHGSVAGFGLCVNDGDQLIGQFNRADYVVGQIDGRAQLDTSGNGDTKTVLLVLSCEGGDSLLRSFNFLNGA